MVGNDLDLVRIAVLPAKADPPLIVETNTVLPDPIALELLEPVARRDTKVLEGLGGVHGSQFPQHDASEIGWISADRLPVEEARSIPVAEALDHAPKLNAVR
jgi:hypothetical protein